MKVLVLWENPAERAAAENLARVMGLIGPKFQNARVQGDSVLIQSGLMYPVEAFALPFDELSNPKGLLPKPSRRSAGDATRWQHRELIFDEDDQ